MAAPASGAPIVAAPAELPAWAQRAVNLADPRLGAEAVMASDEFFAPLSRMLNPEPATFVPGKYDDHGKWMDGWETRRKRTLGHDWSIIRLGRRGRIFCVVKAESGGAGNALQNAAGSADGLVP